MISLNYFRSPLRTGAKNNSVGAYRHAPLLFASLFHAIFVIGLIVRFNFVGYAAETQSPSADGLTPSGLSLDLTETLKLAEKRHIEVLLADERVKQAVARLGQARSVLFPQIHAASSQYRETRNLEANGIKLPQTSPLVGPFNSFDARLTLTQSLFDLEALNRLKAAQADRKLSEAQRLQVRQDVLALAANLFVEAKRAEDQLRVQASFVKRDRENYRVLRARRKNGSAAQTELLTAKRDLRESRYRYRQARTAFIEKRLDLTAALGFEAGTPLSLREQKLNEFPFSTREETKAALESHPEMEAVRQLTRARKAEHWAELAQRFPKISGLAEYGASGATPATPEQTYAIGVKASLPLFEGGRRIFGGRSAQSAVRESENRAQDTRLELAARAGTALAKLREARALIRVKNAEIAVLKAQWAVSKTRYSEGAGSHLELTQMLSARFAAEDERSEALALYAVAQVNLAHALGKMDYFLEK